MTVKYMFDNTSSRIRICNVNNNVIKVDKNKFLKYLETVKYIYKKVYGQIIQKDIQIHLIMNHDGGFTLTLKTDDVNLHDIPKSFLIWFEKELINYIEKYRENGILIYLGRLTYNMKHFKSSINSLIRTYPLPKKSKSKSFLKIMSNIRNTAATSKISPAEVIKIFNGIQYKLNKEERSDPNVVPIGRGQRELAADVAQRDAEVLKDKDIAQITNQKKINEVNLYLQMARNDKMWHIAFKTWENLNSTIKSLMKALKTDSDTDIILTVKKSQSTLEMLDSLINASDVRYDKLTPHHDLECANIANEIVKKIALLPKINVNVNRQYKNLQQNIIQMISKSNKLVDISQYRLDERERDIMPRTKESDMIIKAKKKVRDIKHLINSTYNLKKGVL